MMITTMLLCFIPALTLFVSAGIISIVEQRLEQRLEQNTNRRKVL